MYLVLVLCAVLCGVGAVTLTSSLRAPPSVSTDAIRGERWLDELWSCYSFVLTEHSNSTGIDDIRVSLSATTVLSRICTEQVEAMPRGDSWCQEYQEPRECWLDTLYPRTVLLLRQLATNESLLAAHNIGSTMPLALVTLYLYTGKMQVSVVQDVAALVSIQQLILRHLFPNAVFATAPLFDVTARLVQARLVRAYDTKARVSAVVADFHRGADNMEWYLDIRTDGRGSLPSARVWLEQFLGRAAKPVVHSWEEMITNYGVLAVAWNVTREKAAEECAGRQHVPDSHAMHAMAFVNILLPIATNTDACDIRYALYMSSRFSERWHNLTATAERRPYPADRTLRNLVRRASGLKDLAEASPQADSCALVPVAPVGNEPAPDTLVQYARNVFGTVSVLDNAKIASSGFDFLREVSQRIVLDDTTSFRAIIVPEHLRALMPVHENASAAINPFDGTWMDDTHNMLRQRFACGTVHRDDGRVSMLTFHAMRSSFSSSALVQIHSMLSYSLDESDGFDASRAWEMVRHLPSLSTALFYLVLNN